MQCGLFTWQIWQSYMTFCVDYSHDYSEKNDMVCIDDYSHLYSDNITRSAKNLLPIFQSSSQSIRRLNFDVKSHRQNKNTIKILSKKKTWFNNFLLICLLGTWKVLNPDKSVPSPASFFKLPVPIRSTIKKGQIDTTS